jgi:hypothetical protein
VVGVTSILQAIYDFLAQLVCWIMTALILALNLLLAALGALIEAAVELLPDLDDADIPEVPGPVTTVAGWVNWFFPVTAALQFLTFLFGAWLLWQVVALGLRWAKATSE